MVFLALVLPTLIVAALHISATVRSSLDPFTLNGDVLLIRAELRTRDLPPRFECGGAGVDTDVGPWTPVQVSDDTGAPLAEGVIDSSTLVRHHCVMHFRIDAVCAGPSDVHIAVAGRGQVAYDEATARNGVRLLLVGPHAPAASATGASQREPGIRWLEWAAALRHWIRPSCNSPAPTEVE